MQTECLLTIAAEMEQQVVPSHTNMVIVSNAAFSYWDPSYVHVYKGTTKQQVYIRQKTCVA